VAEAVADGERAGFDLGHRDLDRCRGLRRSTGGRDAGDRNGALGERGGGLTFGRGKRVGRRPLERAEACIDLRQRLCDSFHRQFECGLRRFDFDRRRRGQFAQKLSVGAQFDHYQFRANNDCTCVAAQHRLSDQLDRKGRLRLELPLLRTEGQAITRLKASEHELQSGTAAGRTGQGPLGGTIALAPSDHRPGTHLLGRDNLRIGRGRIGLRQAPVWVDSVSARTALAMSPREGLRRGCVEVSAHTGYPPVKAFCGGG
jgi:hypothetical protein